jgi:hypothetical protein
MWKEYNLISEAVKTAEVPCNFQPNGKSGDIKKEILYLSLYLLL